MNIGNFLYGNGMIGGGNGRLGIGTNAPKATLHNVGSTIFEALAIANLPA